MKKSALIVSLITLGIANLAFAISYFTYLGNLFNYFPVAGFFTILALLLSFAAIIYVVIGLVKCKDASYNPSRMIFGGYGFFIAAFIASRYAITLIKSSIYFFFPFLVTTIFFFVIIIIMLLVFKNSKQYKGNKQYIVLSNSRLSFLSSFAILGLVLLNLISMFLIKDVFYFNRLFTIVGYIFLMLTSILVLVGYSGYVKERGVLPNDKDKEFVNAKPRREGPAPATSSSGSINPKEAEIQNAMKMYGMTREEAESLFPIENKVEEPTAQERSEQLMNEATNRQNSTPSGSGAGFGADYGLGLNFSQAQQSPSQSAKNADPNALAELKREYLQGKITKEEFNKRLAELKK